MLYITISFPQAIACQKIGAVEFLLNNGASWAIEDMLGNTAESFAQEKNYTDVLNLINKSKHKLAA